ncbi:MAG TPA: LON peptidase substrate-binding domain-containing protein, partial [Micromonosporaceae bacterium]
TLHHVGCTAEIRQMTSHPDGRFDLVTVGRRRFRIRELHRGSEPFLHAEIDWIEEPAADKRAELLVPGLLDLFQRYLRLIRTDGHHGGEQLPDDPAVLSYLIAATAVLALDDRQQLLAADTTADRLALERQFLNRELVLLQDISALPIPLGDLAVSFSDN